MRTDPTGKPRTIDDYLATVREDQGAVLQKLRETIHSVAPQAEECISYGLPAFRLDGLLVGFGASSKHCALYPMSGSFVSDHAEELKGFETSKGTIRFQPDAPLPVAFVRKLVQTRAAENRARSQA